MVLAFIKTSFFEYYRRAIANGETNAAEPSQFGIMIGIAPDNTRAATERGEPPNRLSLDEIGNLSQQELSPTHSNIQKMKAPNTAFTYQADRLAQMVRESIVHLKSKEPIRMKRGNKTTSKTPKQSL